MTEIKQKIKASGLRQWQVAMHLGISEFTLARKLRNPSKELVEQIEAVLEKGGVE